MENFKQENLQNNEFVIGDRFDHNFDGFLVEMEITEIKETPTETILTGQDIIHQDQFNTVKINKESSEITLEK